MEPGSWVIVQFRKEAIAAMPRREPTKKVETALSILETFGPATAVHYLMQSQLYEEVLEEPLPERFVLLLGKLSEASAHGGAPKKPDGKSD